MPILNKHTNFLDDLDGVTNVGKRLQILEHYYISKA